MLNLGPLQGQSARLTSELFLQPQNSLFWFGFKPFRVERQKEEVEDSHGHVDGSGEVKKGRGGPREQE